MILGKDLKRVLLDFPDDAKFVAYEGEGTGLNVYSADGQELGWIETGHDRNVECNHSEHSKLEPWRGHWRGDI